MVPSRNGTRSKRLRAALGSIALAMAGFAWLAITGCGSSPPKSPTAATEPPGTLTITGPQTFSERESVSLTATLRSAGGVTSDVTTSVSWASDTPDIVTIDARGVATGIVAGAGRIRASLGAVSATAAVQVSVGRRRFTGVIHESAPTEGTAVAGATVRIIGGSASEQQTVSDSSGRFGVDLVAGAYQVLVAAPGYDPTSLVLTLETNGTPLSLALVPTLREVRFQFAAQPPTPGVFVIQRTFPIDLHHPGEIRVEITNDTYSHSGGEDAFCLELRDSAGRMVAQSRGFYDVRPFPIRQAAGIGHYEVKVLVCDPQSPVLNVPYYSVTTFAGEIKHPR